MLTVESTHGLGSRTCDVEDAGGQVFVADADLVSVGHGWSPLVDELSIASGVTDVQHTVQFVNCHLQFRCCLLIPLTIVLFALFDEFRIGCHHVNKVFKG